MLLAVEMDCALSIGTDPCRGGDGSAQLASLPPLPVLGVFPVWRLSSARDLPRSQQAKSVISTRIPPLLFLQGEDEMNTFLSFRHQ